MNNLLTLTTFFLVTTSIIDITGSASFPEGGYRLPTFQEFLILAPKIVRPSQVYEVHVTVNRMFYSDMIVTALLSSDGNQYVGSQTTFTEVGTKVIQLLVPITTRPGVHKLVVEGLVQNPVRPAVQSNDSNVFLYQSYLPIFHNESVVMYDPKYISLFILTDRPLYVIPAPVFFRIIAVNPELLPASGSMEIYVLDASGRKVRRWIQKQLNFGTYEGGFELEYPVEPGAWSIMVNAFGYEYRKYFDVRFWWQRSFEMNITVPVFMYDTEWGIMGLLYGEHVSGEPGYGIGNITVKVMNKDGSLLPGEISKDLGYMYSTKSFTFSMDEIIEKIGDPTDKDLFFLGTMYDFYYMETLTGTGVTHVYKDGIKLKLLGRKFRTFKPEVPFSIQVAVARNDGTMYTGFYDRQVIVTVITEGSGGGSNTKPEDKQLIPDDNIINYELTSEADDRLIIVVVTHPQSGQSVEVRCYRYYSYHNRYIALSSSTTDPRTESYMTFTLRINFYAPEVNYLISAGGNILLGSKLIMNSKQKTFSVALSRKMAPSARIVAYCIVEGEVVMDSLTFFIRDSRLKQPEIILNYGKDFTRDTIEIVAKGPPGGYVFMNAVDYEFSLRGALPFITEQQVLHELMKYDSIAASPYQFTWNMNDWYWEKTVFFPTQDTGMDTNTTSFAAGLIVMSDANITIRQDFSPCNRSLGLGICPLSGQCYELKTACDGVVHCSDGFDEVACNPTAEEMYVPRPIELDSLFWNSRYQDTWLPFWKSTYIKQVGQGEIKIEQEELMDPLVMGAFFMHPDQGFSIAQEYILHDTTRIFFVTIENPEKIRRGEQVGLRLDIYNYWDQDLEILILLHGDDDYRFIVVEDFGYVVSYSPRTIRGDVQTMVSIKGNQVATYQMFPIVATIPKGEITVRISTYSSQRIDEEDVNIKISYDGVVGRVRHTPYVIDLVNSGSLVIPDLKVNISERFVDPGARDLYYIPYSNDATLYVYGDMVSPGFFDSHLTAMNTVYQYHDSGEGYLFDFAVNLQTLNYLQTLSLLEPDTLEEVLQYMQVVLARQYAYMGGDGEFRMFRRSGKPSVKLSAMALKYLHAALTSTWAEIIYVDVGILNRIGNWLASQQAANGSFPETSDVIDDRSFTPYTVSKLTNETLMLHIPLTAHVVIALSSAVRLTGNARQRVDRAKTDGSNYLASQLAVISDPFQMAITSYALLVSNNRQADTAFNLLMNMRRRSVYYYWAAQEIAPNPTNRINNVEFQYERQFHPNVGNAVLATSYALLGLLARNRKEDAVSTMKWVASQHNRLMGWSSTHDTIIALEAMTEFSYRQTNRAFYNLQLDFRISPNATWFQRVKLDKTNFANLFSFKLTPAYGQVLTRASGTGYAMLAMDTFIHFEKPYQVEAVGPEYESFFLELDSQRFWGRNASHMELNICFKWLRTDLAPAAGMTNVIVDIPTGYVISRDTIEWMYSAGFPGLKRVRFYEQQLITFFEYVSTTRTCFSFVADRWFPVANTSISHLLMIREYAETGMQKLSAYNTYSLFQLHICQVCGSFQCPYCQYYNTATTTIRHKFTIEFLVFNLFGALIALYIVRFVSGQEYDIFGVGGSGR